MLSLDDPRWADLRHAYGGAGDLPALLRQLDDMPSSRDDGEPWFTLWSSVCHQGDVYPASFAVVPHVVRAFASAPERADTNYLQLPAHVEIVRQKNVPVPPDLERPYFRALGRLPSLVAAASSREWDPDFLACALAAVAAAKGFGPVAEAAQELTPEVSERFLAWFFGGRNAREL